jgi:hypothetical protein
MDGEEATPIVEAKSFISSQSVGSSSSTTESSSPPVTPERLIAKKESSVKQSSLALEIPAKDSPAISPETDMSASYHEIFDTQKIGGPLGAEGKVDEEEEDERAADERLAPLFCCDNNTASTTEYLTSKLVEDSLKWQNECAGDITFTATPKDSPLRRRPQNLAGVLGAEDLNKMSILSLKPKVKVDSLDPDAIEDVERHARYLAACVDAMVENLSGVLQSASALTVDTLETYRDGVCKTCDEVDNNIKSMYQLMAKVEELNKSMAPAYAIGDQVKELKKLLDLYESCVSVAK